MIIGFGLPELARQWKNKAIEKLSRKDSARCRQISYGYNFAWDLAAARNEWI
jgi:hypothetical protein